MGWGTCAVGSENWLTGDRAAVNVAAAKHRQLPVIMRLHVPGLGEKANSSLTQHEIRWPDSRAAAWRRVFKWCGDVGTHSSEWVSGRKTSLVEK